MTNEQWQHRVRAMLKEGYGVEDIALELDCSVAMVRDEVKAIREAGELTDVLRRDAA